MDVSCRCEHQPRQVPVQYRLVDLRLSARHFLYRDDHIGKRDSVSILQRSGNDLQRDSYHSVDDGLGADAEKGLEWRAILRSVLEGAGGEGGGGEEVFPGRRKAYGLRCERVVGRKLQAIVLA